MSQNQSPDFLSEDEVRDFLRKNFELELDRDALIKPTRDIMIDIYGRFLEEFYAQEWRNPKFPTDEYQEPNGLALMVSWINFTITPYDISTKFQLKDLLTPVRKRTNYFLNVLIFVKVSHDELDMPAWQVWKSEWAEIQDEFERAHAQLNSHRLALEERAVRKSTSKSIEEIREIRDSKQTIFDDSGRYTAGLLDKSKALKVELVNLEKLVADQQARGDKLDEEYHRLEKKLATLNENVDIKEKFATIKNSLQSQSSKLKESEENLKREQRKVNALQKLMNSVELNAKNTTIKDGSTKSLCSKLQQEEDVREKKLDQANSYLKKLEHREAEVQSKLERADKDRGKKMLSSDIEYERKLNDRQRKITISKELAQSTAKSEEIKDEKEAIKRKRINLLKSQNTIKEEHRARTDKANRQLETLLKIYQDSQKKCEPGIQAIQDYNARIEVLLGKPKEVELPANRTYIKEVGSQKVY